uniref:Synapsin ATP-binding domain-containing protein n=1 Tax=Eptatretus burgeri TaxID=7764 RepID=A0A8C4MZX4_EPTBU
MLAGGHGTSEPCLDAKYSLLMSKVGSSYKAFVQTALPGHWKALPGEMVRKQVAMTDRYQTWVDLCAQLFGGLDICAIKVLHSSNGSNYIIDVMDSTMPLLGESPTEEQQLIADLVLARLERVLSHPQAPPGQSCLEYILDCNGN